MFRRWSDLIVFFGVKSWSLLCLSFRWEREGYLFRLCILLIWFLFRLRLIRCLSLVIVKLIFLMLLFCVFNDSSLLWVFNLLSEVKWLLLVLIFCRWMRFLSVDKFDILFLDMLRYWRFMRWFYEVSFVSMLLVVLSCCILGGILFKWLSMFWDVFRVISLL